MCTDQDWVGEGVKAWLFLVHLGGLYEFWGKTLLLLEQPKRKRERAFYLYCTVCALEICVLSCATCVPSLSVKR